TASSTGAWSFSTPALSDGINAFSVSGTNSAGHTSAPSNPFHVVVEADPPPSTPLVGGANIGVHMEGAEASWTGFPSATDLDYLKSHGVDLVRLPIAWELMQGTLNGPLTQSYLGKLETFLQQAADRGMQVMVLLMNYGEYDPNWQQVAAANNGMFTS